TEVQFQDRLRESVNRVVAKANEAGVQLLASGAKFYMGFDLYQTEPPRPEAAPALGRQLKALEWVMMQLIDNRIISLNKLERTPLAEEGGRPGEGGAASPKPERA